MNMKNKTNFAKNLIATRKTKGFSQRDLAKLSGISNRMIGYYETYSVIPPIEKLEKLSKALDVSISELIDNKLSDKNIIDLDTRTIKKIKLLSQLPPEDQRKVLDYIKDLIEKNRSKQFIESKK